MIKSYYKMPIKVGQSIQEIRADVSLDPADQEIKLLSALTGRPESYFAAMPQNELFAVMHKTRWLADMPNIVNAQPFRLGIYSYKFRLGPSQLSKDEFAFLSKLNSENLVENLHKTLAILTTKYNRLTGRRVQITDSVGEYQARSELFRNNMSFGTAYAYAVFFSKVYPTILKIGLSYFRGVKNRAMMEISHTPPE